ncbi:hypothetical protein BDR22DRAFT_860814 [Usnea florida]
MEDGADSFTAKTIQRELESSNMDINIAEKNVTAELDKQDFSNPKKENLGPGQAEGTADARAETKLVQDDDDALFEDLLVAEDLSDTDRIYLDCEAAEDADDEVSSDNDDYERILPLNMKKSNAANERGLREEKETRGRVKGNLAERDVANGGVWEAGMPRIDYGAPGLGIALGGSSPTEEERAQARRHFEGY